MNHSEEFVLGSKPKVIHSFLLHLLTELLSKNSGRSHCLPRLVTVDPVGCRTGWEIILVPLGMSGTAGDPRPAYEKPLKWRLPLGIHVQHRGAFDPLSRWFAHQLHFRSEGLRVRKWGCSGLTRKSAVSKFMVASRAVTPPSQSPGGVLSSEVLRCNGEDLNSEVSYSPT